MYTELPTVRIYSTTLLAIGAITNHSKIIDGNRDRELAIADHCAKYIGPIWISMPNSAGANYQ